MIDDVNKFGPAINIMTFQGLTSNIMSQNLNTKFINSRTMNFCFVGSAEKRSQPPDYSLYI